jgi:hypothetical protein
LVRWREITLKNKLATLFFKRKVFRALKYSTYRKAYYVPRKFHTRYRQILVFKVLRYETQARRKLKRRMKESHRLFKVTNLLTKAMRALKNHSLQSKATTIGESAADQFHAYRHQRAVLRGLRVNMLKAKK